MLPATAQRVPLATSDAVNQQIRDNMLSRVEYFDGATPAQIRQRLQRLDEEWDVERTLEANASTLVLTGSLLALTVDRRWALLPMTVAGFLFQHAIQGWCPPLPVLRQLGFRTIDEINEERLLLKQLLQRAEEAGSTR